MAEIKKLATIIILLSSHSCNTIEENKTIKEHVSISNKINSELIIRLAKEKKLKLQGTGASMMDNVKMVGLDFLSEEPSSLEEARILIVDVTEELLKTYNANEQIRPFLANYPLNSNNVHIMISFPIESSYRENKKIVFVYTKNGHIYYCDYDTEKERYTEIFQEPYEDALKKHPPTINNN